MALLAALAYAGYRLRRPLPAWPPLTRRPAPPPAREIPGETQWETALRAQLRAVPKGRVVTFADLANRVGLGVSIQTVSRQVRGYQQDRKTPWWRAVRRDGARGIVPDSELGQKQQALLEKEGVIFQKGGFRFADHEWQEE